MMEKATLMLKRYKVAILLFSTFFIVAAAAVSLSVAGELCLPNEKTSSSAEIISIGGRDLLNMSNLTMAEKELYRTLSKNGGVVTQKAILSTEEQTHWDEVVLKKGDSLRSVAQNYQMPANDLLKINGIDGAKKRENDLVIFVPRNRQYIQETFFHAKEMKKLEEEFFKRKKLVSVLAYIVKEDDNLWSIAQRFNLSADTIIGANSPEKINSLRTGTVLRIPDREGVFVRVPTGESIESLAYLYGTKIDRIYSANGIDSISELSQGREIFLPGASYAAVIQTEDGKIKVTTGRENFLRKTFMWPVKGRISSLFGWRKYSYGSGSGFHSGLDIVAPHGRAIFSAKDGVVVYSGWMGGYGRTVVIDHSDSITTLYGHCSELAVRKGDQVYSGQLISYIGSTGRSTGSHLHFEVRKNSYPFDPLSVLR